MDLENIKELHVNDELYAKYSIDGDIIYLKAIKEIKDKYDLGRFESNLVSLISIVEDKKFSMCSYLNI